MNELEQQIKQALDEKLHDLDASSLSRLRRAREKALDQPLPWWRTVRARMPVLAGPSGVLYMPSNAWLGLAAGVMLLSVLLLGRGWFSASLDPMHPSSDMLEIMTLDVDLELIENIEFYDWLEQQMSVEADR